MVFRCYGGAVNTLGGSANHVPERLLPARGASCLPDVNEGNVAGRSWRVLTTNERRVGAARKGNMPAAPLLRSRADVELFSEVLEVAGSNPVARLCKCGRSSDRLERQLDKASRNHACDHFVNPDRSGSVRVGSLRNQGGPSSHPRGLARCEEGLICSTYRPEDSGGPMTAGYLYMTEELARKGVHSGRRPLPARPSGSLRITRSTRTGRRTMVTSLCQRERVAPHPSTITRLSVHPVESGGPKWEPVIPGSSPGCASGAVAQRGDSVRAGSPWSERPDPRSLAHPTDN